MIFQFINFREKLEFSYKFISSKPSSKPKFSSVKFTEVMQEPHAKCVLSTCLETYSSAHAHLVYITWHVRARVYPMGRNASL